MLYSFKKLGFVFSAVIIILLTVGLFKTIQQKHVIHKNFCSFGLFSASRRTNRSENPVLLYRAHYLLKTVLKKLTLLIYQSAKNFGTTSPFITQLVLNQVSCEGFQHSMFRTKANEELPRIIVSALDCIHPYSASLLNSSALSFGTLNENTIIVLNKVAQKRIFYHNTDEGGIT